MLRGHGGWRLAWPCPAREVSATVMEKCEGVTPRKLEKKPTLSSLAVGRFRDVDGLRRRRSETVALTCATMSWLQQPWPMGKEPALVTMSSC